MPSVKCSRINMLLVILSGIKFFVCLFFKCIHVGLLLPLG